MERKLAVVLAVIGALLLLEAVPMSSNAQSANLVYRGGAVLHTSNTYVIYWLPSGYHYEGYLGIGLLGSDSNYESLIDRFLNDLSGSSYLNIVSQYSDNLNGSALDKTTFAGAYIDTSPYPFTNGTLTDVALKNEIVKVMQIEGWSGGLGNIFFLFTGLNVDYSQDLEAGFCAYHSYFTSGGQTILWANMPDMHGYLLNLNQPCSINAPGFLQSTPNKDDWADNEISTVSHELFETITDPTGHGWIDSSGAEIGDKCAYQAGIQNSDGSNLILNGHEYIVQEEWSNFSGGCTLGYGPSTTISIGFTPSSGSNPGAFNLTYSSMGAEKWVRVDNNLGSYSLFLDANSQFQVTSIGNGNSERWCFTSDCSPLTASVGACTAGYVCIVSFSDTTYYDLVEQSIGVDVLGGGSPSIPVQYVTAPASPSGSDVPMSASVMVSGTQQIIWAERGSIISAASTTGGPSERWTANVLPWTADSPGFSTVIPYQHQFLVTFAVSIVGGGSGYTSPEITYDQLGQISNTQSGTAVWADANAPYNFPSALPGSSPTERWAAQQTTGQINGAGTISVQFFHQFAVELSFTSIGGSPSASPVVTGNQFGVATNIMLTTNGVFQWFDAGTNLAFGSIAGGTGERWVPMQPSFSVGSVGALNQVYVHQYYLQFIASPASEGQVSPASGWYNASTPLEVIAQPSTGYLFSGWSTSNPSLMVADSSSHATVLTVAGSGDITGSFASVNPTTTHTTTATSSVSTSSSQPSSTTSSQSGSGTLSEVLVVSIPVAGALVLIGYLLIRKRVP